MIYFIICLFCKYNKWYKYTGDPGPKNVENHDFKPFINNYLC